MGLGFLACGHLEGESSQELGVHGWEHLWNLQVGAPEMSLADNGEFVMKLQQKQVKAKDFRREW